MSLLIRGAEIVTASDRYMADVKVTDERIAAIGAELPAESGDEIVDGSDQWLIPGGIDPHVHMALPFMGTVSIDDFESGSIAAIMGGTTGMIDFVIPAKGESLLATLDTWHAKAAGKAAHEKGGGLLLSCSASPYRSVLSTARRLCPRAAITAGRCLVGRKRNGHSRRAEKGRWCDTERLQAAR